MARLIQEKIKRPLAEELLFGDLSAGGHVQVTTDENDQLVLKTRKVLELETVK